MGKFIKGTHHVAIKYEDEKMFDEALKFYCDILDMELLRTWGEGADRGAMVDTGNSIIEMFASGRTIGETGSVNHYALETDDVDGCVEAVRKAGYRIKSEPEDIVIGSVPPYPARIAFCYGPAGEEIEFFHVK